MGFRHRLLQRVDERGRLRGGRQQEARQLPPENLPQGGGGRKKDLSFISLTLSCLGGLTQVLKTRRRRASERVDRVDMSLCSTPPLLPVCVVLHEASPVHRPLPSSSASVCLSRILSKPFLTLSLLTCLGVPVQDNKTTLSPRSLSQCGSRFSWIMGPRRNSVVVQMCKS